MIHVTCKLTAKNRDQLRNPTLGNRVWATFLSGQEAMLHWWQYTMHCRPFLAPFGRTPNASFHSIFVTSHYGPGPSLTVRVLFQSCSVFGSYNRNAFPRKLLFQCTIKHAQTNGNWNTAWGDGVQMGTGHPKRGGMVLHAVPHITQNHSEVIPAWF